MEKKNILLISWYYFPELTPRAFRANELVKEFCRQGHQVTLFIPNKEIFSESPHLDNNLKTNYVGNLIRKNKEHLSPAVKESGKESTHKKTILKRITPLFIKTIIKQYIEFHHRYFYPVQNKQYISDLYYELISETGNYDILYSVGLPVESHIAAARALKSNPILRNIPATVAEYGDPFSSRQKGKIFMRYYFTDLFITRTFNYISVPTSKALNSYKRFFCRKKMLVLPQAFNLAEYKPVKYQANHPVTFAYCGVFYHKIRNPRHFFDYLLNLKIDFRLIIYTISQSRYTVEILEEYKALLKGKLIVRFNTDRYQIIEELGRFDFLINLENTTSNQIPSKLIDYAIAKRPICQISTRRNDYRSFDQFLKGNYSTQSVVNIGDFDIRKITSQILMLTP